MPGNVSVREYGAGPPLVALHGFTLTGAQFEPLANHLGRSILAPDLPGHGTTRVTPVDVPTTIAALTQWLQGVDTPVPVLGYSMGGRIALSLALDRPSVVDRLIMVSAGPGIEDSYSRAMRTAEDSELAGRIRNGGMNRFVDEWLSAPVTSTASVDEATRSADRAVRAENTPSGLAAAVAGLGQGTFPYLGDRLGKLGMPLLVVSGARDERYTEQSAAMAKAAPNGEHVVIEGAGHNVVLEAPGELAAAVEDFLRQ